MNADKLIKIAKLLDEKNHFALADKFDKIAQKISVNDKTIVAQSTRDYFGLDQTGNSMDNFLKNTRLRYPGGASLIPGLSNQDTRVMGPFGFDMGSKRFVERQRAFGRGLRNLVMNTPEYQQYQGRYNSQQNQPQQQDPLLISTTPDQFVNNLFAYGKKFGLSDLAQTMDLYANQGGTLSGQPVNQNPQALKLYDQVKNYAGNLSQAQVMSMLTGMGTRK
jgi:hypothetical protein